MADKWLDDVRKYAADADENIVAGIVRYCGIALRKVDSSLVSFSDSKETDRVRENFLKKKLGLTDSDATLDAAIAKVGERMKADRTKNRVTVYYLLADQFSKLGLFAGAKKAAAGAAVAAAAVGATAAAAATKKPVAKPAAPKAAAKAAAPKAAPKPAATKPAATKPAAPKPAAAKPAAVKSAAPVAAAAAVTAAAATAAAAPLAAMSAPAPAPVAPAPKGHDDDHGGAAIARPGDGIFSTGCLVALGLAALFIVGIALVTWYLKKPEVAAPVVAPAPVAAPAVVEPAPAPAPAPVAAPEGSGVRGGERDGKPMLTVYFDTGRSDVAADFPTVSSAVVAYLKANPASTIEISGFNDPTGNKAANERLSKARAEKVKAALEAQGIAPERALMVKPAEASGTGATNAESRRVEAVIKG
jgi:outer membrane protein OmpA-like peptidoglycan-associated protein